MSQDLRTTFKQRLESGEVRLQPLTYPQRELWETSPVPVEDVANHICAFIQVKGTITLQDCQAAIQRVVDRQEVLRLSFLAGKGQHVQVIRAAGTPMMTHRELPPGKRSPEAVEDAMQEVFNQPFDLLRGPLYRVQLLQRGPDDLLLVFAIHHAIADGWTLGVFVQDLAAAYIQEKRGGARPLPPVAMTYTAWGAAERAFWQPAELEPRAAFWKSRLAGAIRLWERPSDVHARSGKLRRWVSAIQPGLTRGVREAARGTSTTLFGTLLTAFQSTLAAWTGKDDITVGTPVANRTRQDVRETMGYFAGIVPLRGHVERDRPFVEAVRMVHQNTVDSFANAMPFVELTKALGIEPAPGHNPVFDVRFALQNHPIPDVTLPNLSLKLRMRSTGTARFDLGCEITEDGEELEVVWLFRPSLFTDADIKELDRRYQAVLANVSRSLVSRTAAVMA